MRKLCNTGAFNLDGPIHQLGMTSLAKICSLESDNEFETFLKGSQTTSRTPREKLDH